MRNKGYTLSDLITDLQAIEAEHGDIEVVDARNSPLFGRHIEVAKIDDWNNTTKTDDGEVPGVAYVLQIGRMF